MPNPSFEAAQTNPFNLTDVGYSSRPTFADIDNDNDLDAFVGADDGNIYYFQNTGTASSPSFAAAQTNPFNLTDVGYSSAPTFADIDNDNDLDAFVGEYFGRTFYFKNTGTAIIPSFAAVQINPFNLTGVGNISTPTFADIDKDNDLDAFVGASFGNTYYFENTGTAIIPSFAAVQTNPFNLTDVGNTSRPTFADIDKDNDLDAFVGEYDGNTYYFQNGPTANTAPTDISLSPSSINENVAANSNIGSFTSTDPDTGNTFTYTLVAGTGDTDNAAFTIASDKLNINASPDYETKSTYNIRVKTTDQGGLSYEQPLTVTIKDVNEVPTNLSISNSSINENVAANSNVGSFTSTDPDTGNTFTYTLVAGTGDTDNSAFTIASDKLNINASPDYETKSSYSIRVQTTDQGGLTYEKPLTVTIKDVNEVPTNLSISNSSINENVAANSNIGSFTSTDPDTGNTFTYSLVTGTGDTDNAAFTIASDKLNINASPNFEAKSSYSIRVRTTDQGGLIYEKPLTVTIKDIDESVSLTPNNDIFNGTAGVDQVKGLAGSDRIYGNAGNDTIDGGEGNDIVYGGDDDDLLRGGNGSDRLYGDAGNDQLYGDAGNDILYGGNGDNLLDGGAGSDQIYGNTGIDTFVLAIGMGQDLINNFEDSKDKIRLDGGLTFADLKITQSGASTLIKVLASGVTLASLTHVNSTLIGSADFI